MKNSVLAKTIGAGVLAFGLTALPVSAQTTTTPNSGTGGTTTTQPGTTTTDVNRDNNDSNWGWLGLLGLAGLFGLTGRKRREDTAYRDPNPTVGSTTYRE